MASSPAEPAAADSPRAQALRELTACWDQGYEALAMGDLERLEALLAIAETHAAQCDGEAADSPAEAAWRSEALAARGRLEAGMRDGLLGIAAELAKVRHGNRALRGYGDPQRRLGNHVERTL